VRDPNPRSTVLRVALGLAAFAGCSGHHGAAAPTPPHDEMVATTNPDLAVTGLDPATGAGGTTVTLAGRHFTADGPRTARVYFGDNAAAVDGFDSDETLIVTAPPGIVGEVVDVLIVFDPGGEITLPHAFTYRAP
jgi:hypothetical protein